MQNCPWNKLIDVPRSCWKRKSFENFNLLFACCRISQWDVQHLILVDSDDSPWGRLHGQIETSCNFHSNHSRAGTKWPLSIFFFNPKSVCWMWRVFHFIPNCIKKPWCPRRHTTSFTFSESYIGSFKATINSDLIHNCLKILEFCI